MSQVVGVDCPLLTALLPANARDKGVPDKAHDPGVRARVWADILDSTGPLARTFPRMNMCRWYGWWDCFDHWREYWHQRLVIMLYRGISQKIITGDVQSVTMRVKGLSKGVGEASSKDTMRQTRSNMANIRAVGKTAS